MSMTGIVQEIHADALLAQYPSPVQGTIAVPGFLGSANRLQRLEPPAIAWVPAADRYSAPQTAIGRNSSATGFIQRTIAKRSASFEAHVHAELSPPGDTDDFVTCEALVDRLLYVVHTRARGNYRLLSGRWVDVDGEALQDRKVYVLTLELDLPVAEPADLYTRATILQAPVSGGMTFPDGDVIGPSTPPP